MSPTARSLSFRLDGSGYEAGDDRPYDVVHRGRIIGVVERTWLVAAKVGGEPTSGWSFRSLDGRTHGEGRSRAAAVLSAYNPDQEKT